MELYELDLFGCSTDPEPEPVEAAPHSFVPTAGIEVLIDSPPSFYHGLKGTVTELCRYGLALVSFRQSECDRAAHPQRTEAERPIPFELSSLLDPRDTSRLRPAWRVPGTSDGK